MRIHFEIRDAVVACLILAHLHGSLAGSIPIPPPTGPYSVGITKQTIPYYNTHDPVSPNGTSTRFLATIFYPTAQKLESEPEPYLNPETAAYYEQQFNYSTGVLASMTSTLQKDAPFLTEYETEESPHPTLIYNSCGIGPPTEVNTILLSDLASYGYVIIGLDHPFEQPFIRFPDGTTVNGVTLNSSDLTLVEEIYELRLLDNNVFLDYLPELTTQLDAPFDTSKLGIFGCSLGGASALGSLQVRPELVSGLNVDGSFWGNLTTNTSVADVAKPVFLLGMGGHAGDWTTFPLWQTGSYFGKVLVQGALHHDFRDDAFWKTVDQGSDPSLGTIDGFRAMHIVRTIVKAFFNYTLLGHRSPILEGPSEEWPELQYWNKTSGL
ncbi:hypothetical protein GGR57DRAFT_483215 [Xylariaceae sp. FL1272]|nr:hypothetical protein GGR57DRAFT_483215 [Xylariaceae sp. FL1272]